MLGIIAYHLFVSVIKPQLDGGSPEFAYFTVPHFYPRLFCFQFLYTLGNIGNHLFVLIAGYFLINTTRQKIVDSARKIIPQVFWAIFVLLIAGLVIFVFGDKYNYNFDAPPMDFYWWFIGYYLIIVAIATGFLNKYIAKSGRKIHLAIIVILFVLSVFTYWSKIITTISGGGDSRIIIGGILVYLIGGYIRLYNPLQKLRVGALFGGVILIYACIFALYYIRVREKIHDFRIAASPDAVFVNAEFVEPGFTQWYIIIIAVLVFEIFRRLDIGHNRVINIISAASLMAFMIHFNPLVISAAGNINWVELLYEHKLRFGPYVLLFCLACYIAALICYYVFKFLAYTILPRCKRVFLRE
jgi:surface polysaccharide O-acyltransferase-like enzyme